MLKKIRAYKRAFHYLRFQRKNNALTVNSDTNGVALPYKAFITKLIVCFSLCGMTLSAYAQSQAVLLVSLGMPTLVLRQYVQQAKRLHIPLVIRGLYHGSMQATGHRVYQLLHPKHHIPIKSGVLIDPKWFEQYHVHVVPTLIVKANDKASVISGNLPLTSLLTQVATRTHYTVIQEAANHSKLGEISS